MEYTEKNLIDFVNSREGEFIIAAEVQTEGAEEHGSIRTGINSFSKRTTIMEHEEN